MSLKFMPDYYFESFRKIDIAFMLENGFKAILMDVDNTLEPYEHPTPGEEVVDWIENLKQNGIKFAIISNNNAERIELFNKALGLPAFPKAKKPFKKYYLRALADLNVSTDEAVFIGDQIFTDVWGAHNAKIRAVLVPPIKDKRDIFTRLKRLLEKLFVRKIK